MAVQLSFRGGVRNHIKKDRKRDGWHMLGLRIALCRKARGMSQAALAKRLGVSPSTVGMYEQGRREPSCDILIALSREFGVTIDYLLTGETDSRTHHLPEESLSKEELLTFFLTQIMNRV